MFGCLSYATSLKAHRTKFDSRARKAIFIGHKDGTKGYILYDLQTHEIFISRNVIFYETVFPFKDVQPPLDNTNQTFSLLDDIPNENPPPNPTEHLSPTMDHSPTIYVSPQDSNVDTTPQPINSPSPSPSPVTASGTTPDMVIPTPYLNDNSPFNTTNPSPTLNHTLDSTVPTVPSAADNTALPTRHSSRTSNPPQYLQDYHCYSTTSQHHSNVLYPLSSVLTYDHCSPSYKHFCCAISSNTEPKTFNQAIKLDCWKLTMNAEISALEENQTWSVVDLPPGKIPIGCRWVYKIKYKADGSIERYKARLVAKGYTQMEGIDYFDTFSLVAKITTVRVLLTIVAIQGWYVEQLDVNNAFLHGDFHEEVYMTLPPGISISKPSQVCKLRKSLYGLKQASRQWYSKLSSFLISLGYAQSQADHSLYVKSHKEFFTAILVYVDDIVVAGNSMLEIQNVKHLLDQKFRIKDLGSLRFFLGFEIARSTKGIFMNQRKYTLELLEDTGFLGAKPSLIPYDPNLKLSPTDGTLLEDPTRYRRLIGRLIYLTNTRPDISFDVQHLSQFVSKPLVSHFQAATRVLWYLKSCPARAFYSLLPAISNYLPLLIPIGLDAPLQEDPLLASVSYLVHPLSAGNLRSKIQFQDPPLKLSTGL